MAVNLNDLPPEVRKKVEALALGTSKQISEAGPIPPLVLTAHVASGETARTRRVQEVPTCTWRCHECNEPFTAWAKVERHADATKHARIECVLT